MVEGYRLRRSGLRAGTAMLALCAAGAAGAQESDDELPSRSEMWRIIQQQQDKIDSLESRLEAQTQTHEETDPVEPAAPARDARETAQGQRRRTAEPAPESDKLEQLDRRVERNAERVEATGDLLENALSDAGLGGEGWWNRVSVGGYGSVRFEESDLANANTGFEFRRFVLTTHADVTDRLETFLELELERFGELELEKGVSSEPGEFEVEQAVEGTSSSELAVEQAWARYKVSEALNFEIGGVLVPLGRFNVNHDDNQWVLPRRSLVDRGVPVLPAKAAWPELGAGFTGSVELGGGALLDYRFYALNGVALDFELEEKLIAATEESGESELESKLEAEFAPTQGAFDGNSNDTLALSGRAALKPAPGQEIGVSGYFGNYVPDFLDRDETVWSLAVDGLHNIGGFEVEYQGVTTRWDEVRDVAAAVSSRALAKERGIEGPLEGGAFGKHEVEFTLSSEQIAEQKTGYWVELRHPFWPEALDGTFLARGFDEPKLIPTFRFEQVFMDDQLREFEFNNGTITAFDTRDTDLSRATLGLGYQPAPGWIFQIGGEYTWTDEPSLEGLTNFLPGTNEDDAFSFLMGLAFGF